MRGCLVAFKKWGSRDSIDSAGYLFWIHIGSPHRNWDHTLACLVGHQRSNDERCLGQPLCQNFTAPVKLIDLLQSFASAARICATWPAQLNYVTCEMESRVLWLWKLQDNLYTLKRRLGIVSRISFPQQWYHDLKSHTVSLRTSMKKKHSIWCSVRSRGSVFEILPSTWVLSRDIWCVARNYEYRYAFL
jgi:hypothetical protein